MKRRICNFSYVFTYYTEHFQLYLKSRLNCLLMSSTWTCEEDKMKPSLLNTDSKNKTENNDTENADDETLWASLPVVHTKKLKRKPKHEKFETDISDIGLSANKKRTKISNINKDEQKPKTKRKGGKRKDGKSKYCVPMILCCCEKFMSSYPM